VLVDEKAAGRNDIIDPKASGRRLLLAVFYPETQGEPLKRAIRAFLTHKGTPDGRVAPAAVATADLTKWIEGTPPTLQ
jgi:hypothetical protein